jgi:hypothetical protein
MAEGMLVVIGDIDLIEENRWCHQYRMHFFE